MAYTVAAFYKFVGIADAPQLRDELHARCLELGIVGTILIAPEGINSTIAGAAASMTAILAHLRADPRFADLEVKLSASTHQPFKRLKVKLKREIVTFGVPEANPALRVGTYVDAADWNALISSDDVILIDTRNSYEYGVGTFPGALDPGTRAFGEFPQYVAQNLDSKTNKKVAMFCTGGIRCEKATAFMLGLGFEHVYHLKGGILKYLETVPADQSLWQGECFVFDERVALGQGVAEGHTALCRACGHPHASGAPCAVCSLATKPSPAEV
jgi:UPF0176 protein